MKICAISQYAVEVAYFEVKNFHRQATLCRGSQRVESSQRIIYKGRNNDTLGWKLGLEFFSVLMPHHL